MTVFSLPRILRTGIKAGVVASVMSASFIAPASAMDKVTLLLDWFVNPDHGPIIIAQEKGYFSDAGLDVEVIAPADPADPPKLTFLGHLWNTYFIDFRWIFDLILGAFGGHFLNRLIL